MPSQSLCVSMFRSIKSFMNELIMTHAEDMVDTEEPTLYLYVERSTGYVYQAQLFDTFVLFRPATPGFEEVVRKMSCIDFLKEFYEYEGNYDEFYLFASGKVDGLTVY